MNTPKPLLLAVFVGIVSTRTVFSQAQPTEIPNDAQLVSQELMDRLEQKRLEFRDSMWPKDIAQRKVPETQIPDTVVQNTVHWIHTMIKDPWVPANVRHWIVGIRKPKLGFFALRHGKRVRIAKEGTTDYLAVRWKIDGHKIQVQENGIGMLVLIEPTESIRQDQSIEDFVAETIYKFLKFPKDKKSTLKFELKSDTYKDQANKSKRFYWGVVDCDYDQEKQQAWNKRTWWNHTIMWTDGEKVYLGLVEMDGKPRMPTQPRPGIPARFTGAERPASATQPG